MTGYIVVGFVLLCILSYMYKLMEDNDKMGRDIEMLYDKLTDEQKETLLASPAAKRVYKIRQRKNTTNK